MLCAYSGAQPLINRMRVCTQWSPVACAMAGAQAALPARLPLVRIFGIYAMPFHLVKRRQVAATILATVRDITQDHRLYRGKNSRRCVSCWGMPAT